MVAGRRVLVLHFLCLTIFTFFRSSYSDPIISVAPVGCYGGISTFYCASDSSNVKRIGWRIIVDGNTDDIEITDEIAQLRGISITTNGVGNSSSLSIIGSKDNNGITISCITVESSSGSSSIESAGAVFTVSDIPPVTNLTITFTNNGLMNCTWIQPSCLPVNSSYHVLVNNEEMAILYNKDQTNFIYPDVSSCETYNVSVIVGDTVIQYQSQPNTLSVTSDFYGDIAIEFLQDQSEVTFTDEGKSTVNLFYKFQNSTNIHKCHHLKFFQQVKSFEWTTELDIENPFQSYDESTGIGNYTIGPFNESFIGNYTLMLKKSSSDEPLKLLTKKISTFHVQEVNISQLSNGSTKIECGFAINSDADGCSVKFTNMQSLQKEAFFIPKTSTDKDTATMIIDIPEGEYNVSVYDVVDGVKQSSTPAKTLLDINICQIRFSDDPVSTLLPSMITPTSTGVISNTVVSIDGATPLITIPPTITTTESPDIINCLIVVGSVCAILLILLLVMIVLLIVCKWRQKNEAAKKSSLHSKADHTQSQPDGPPNVSSECSNNDDLKNMNDEDGNINSIQSSIMINKEKDKVQSSELVTDSQPGDPPNDGLEKLNVNQSDETKKAELQPFIERFSAIFEKYKKFCNTGIFKKAYQLSQIIFKLIMKMGDNKHFIPSALPKPDEAAHTPFDHTYCRPLVIKYENSFSHGFYNIMVDNLLSSSVNDKFKFERCNDVNQLRNNEIQIREVTGKISGIIKLTDKNDWIEISTTTVNTKEDCPSIYEVMDEAIVKTLRRFKYAGLDQPTVTTLLCPLCPSTEEDHLCILSMADNTVTCSIDSSKTGCVTEDISCWFEHLWFEEPNSGQPSF